MGRGTHRGFITYEELSKSLGKRNLSDENLAQAFIHILDENIILVEKKSDYKILRKKDSSSKDEGVVASVVPVVLKNSYPSSSKSSAESDLNVLNNTLISELECLCPAKKTFNAVAGFSNATFFVI